jgi:4-amino-4-deoxy-L-arabinose transferase-like glycosyltransferase
MTETLFSTLLIVSVYYFVLYLQEDRYKHLIISSILIGLAMLCRPIGIFIPLVLGIFLIFHHRKKLVKAVQHVLIFGLVIVCTISPWLIRNKIQFDGYFLSVIAEHNLQNFQAAVIYSEVMDLPINEARCSLRWNTFNEFKGDANKEPLHYAHFIRKDALEIVKQHPSIALRNQLQQVVHFFVKPTRSYIDLQWGYSKNKYDSITQQKSITEHLMKKSSRLTIVLVVLQLLILCVLYLGVFLSFFYFTKHKKLLFWFLLLAIIFCFANLTIPNVTEARFRIPVMPFITILSACGWFFIYNKFIHSKNKA